MSRFDEWMALRARKRLDGVESNGEYEQTLTHTEELLQVSRNVLNNTRELLREVKVSRKNSQQSRRARKKSMKA